MSGERSFYFMFRGGFGVFYVSYFYGNQYSLLNKMDRVYGCGRRFEFVH